MSVGNASRADPREERASRGERSLLGNTAGAQESDAFSRDGRMDPNSGRGWLSKALLEPLEQLCSAKSRGSPLLDIRQPGQKLLFPRFRCISIGSPSKAREQIMCQLRVVRIGEGFGLVPDLFKVRA